MAFLSWNSDMILYIKSHAFCLVNLDPQNIHQSHSWMNQISRKIYHQKGSLLLFLQLFSILRFCYSLRNTLFITFLFDWAYRSVPSNSSNLRSLIFLLLISKKPQPNQGSYFIFIKLCHMNTFSIFTLLFSCYCYFQFYFSMENFFMFSNALYLLENLLAQTVILTKSIIYFVLFLTA